MTTQEMIAKVQNAIFMLAMKDRWDRKDYDYNAELNAQLRKLEKAVA